MKVSTDACIQGAWTPLAPNMRRILDIGAGTGLLSLMMAQRAPDARIDALELHEAAAVQAAENAAASPFADRIHVHHIDATNWTVPYLYEYIICNPPFFKDSLLGPDAARNAARHGASLNPAALIDIICRHLAPHGTASVMWPEEAHHAFVSLAAARGLYLQRSLQVRDRAATRVTRVIGIYGRAVAEAPLTETLVIKTASGAYTADFAGLLATFYLYL